VSSPADSGLPPAGPPAGPAAGPQAGWTGGRASGRAGSVASCVLAPNPGPMTLDGTNTWLLLAPGGREAVVVDPGPDHQAHLAAVLEQVRSQGARVGTVLLTHGHPDHSEGAARFAQLAGAPVRALDPRHRLGGEGLQPGDRILAGELELQVVGTPGHTSDSLCFVLPQVAAVLTGDTVLGRGSTVVAHPDGRLEEYLDSLQRLARLADELPLEQVLPGHGPQLADPAGVLEAYRRHRAERLEQVRAAVDAGASSPEQVVAVVYADVDRSLWPAAELSVRAQLDYLARLAQG
jgi:glyoxylase-like metal-dependent hydrolase (beta-lactamase superfamily II)